MPLRRRSLAAACLVALLLAAAVVASQEALDRTREPITRPPEAAATPRTEAGARSRPEAPERGVASAAVGPPPRRVRLATRDVLRLRTGPTPKGALAFDLGSGRVLWRRRAERPRPIASLTKVMTALVAVDAVGPRERVRIPRVARRTRGSSMGGLAAGRRVRAETLLHGLLIQSGNDAAVALAVHAAGSERRFVRRMNRRARALGLRCTRFENVHGLDRRPPGTPSRGAANRSCPADLAELTVRAMGEPRIARIVRRRSARVWLPRRGAWWLRTTHPLLRAGHPGVIGLKTGWTPAAGRCLITVARVGGRNVGVVLLGARDPAGTTRRVLRAAGRRS